MSKSIELPAIVLTNPKYPHNVAGIIRACSCWGAKSLLWTGNRVDPANYSRLPREERMKGYRDVAWIKTERPFDLLPPGTVPVAVELVQGSVPLTTFEHPANAAYIFGPEDGGITQVFRRFCHHFVYIPTHHCLNLSQAVNMVLGHRRIMRQLKGKEPILTMADMLHEQRGVAEIDCVGWDGK